MVVTLRLVGGGQRLERRGDLGRQLTGGRQAPDRSVATAPLHGCKPGDQWDGEGERLTAASLAAAQHISAGERVGKRLLLDRERGEDSARGERLDQFVVHAEISESLLRSNGRCLSGIGLCFARANDSARASTSLARLPVGNIDRREKTLCCVHDWEVFHDAVGSIDWAPTLLSAYRVSTKPGNRPALGRSRSRRGYHPR